MWNNCWLACMVYFIGIVQNVAKLVHCSAEQCPTPQCVLVNNIYPLLYCLTFKRQPNEYLLLCFRFNLGFSVFQIFLFSFFFAGLSRAIVCRQLYKKWCLYVLYLQGVSHHTSATVTLLVSRNVFCYARNRITLPRVRSFDSIFKQNQF